MTENITLGRNTIYASLSRYWLLLIGFITTPYIATKLGLERFGLWSILFVIISYLSFLELGLTHAFTKYVAEYHEKGEIEKVNSVIATGIFFYGIVGIVVTIAMFFLSKQLLIAVGINPDSDLFVDASYGIFWTTLVLCGGLIQSVLRGAIQGYLRFDLHLKLSVILSTLENLVLIALLHYGYGIIGLTFSSFLWSLVGTLAFYFVMKKLDKKIVINLPSISISTLRKLFRYGIPIQISGLSGLVNKHIDKLLISMFLSLNYVSFYEVGRRLAILTYNIPLGLFSAILPRVSALNSSGKKEEIKDLYAVSTRIAFFIIFPIATFCITNADLIITTWMGKGFEKSFLVLQVLGLGYMVHVTTGTASSIARGVEKNWIEAKSAFLVLVTNIILSVILVLVMGFKGIVFGTALSMMMGCCLYMYYFEREVLPGGIRIYGKYFLLAFLSSFIASISNLVLRNWFFPKVLLIGGRFEQGRVILVCLFVYLLVYVFFSFLAGMLKIQDIRSLKETFISAIVVLRNRSIVKEDVC